MTDDAQTPKGPPLGRLLLGLLVAMCVVFGVVVVIGEAEPSHGVPHPDFPGTMLAGGAAALGPGPIRWLGLALGLVEVAFFVGCLMLAMRRLEGKTRIFLMMGAAYALAFAAMVVADHYYVTGASRTIVLGFPLPTALMVYGVGGVPVLFCLLYVVQFDRWILTPDDMARFERLVEAKRKGEEADR